jgi:hypothetical protein
MLLLTLNKDGSFFLSDGTSGKLTDTELAPVDDAISAFSQGDLSGAWSCDQNRSTEAAHVLYLTFPDNRQLTMAASDPDQVCGLGVAGNASKVHAALLPIIQAHYGSPAGSPVSPTMPETPAPAPEPAPAPAP